MGTIKSLLLSLGAVFFLVAAVVFINIGVMLVILPSEYEELTLTATERIINEIPKLTFFKNQLSAILGENIPEENVGLVIAVSKKDCIENKSVEESLGGICEDLLGGKIRNKTDIENSFLERQVKPTLKKTILDAFEKAKPGFISSKKIIVINFLLFAVSFSLAFLCIYLYDGNILRTARTIVHNMASLSLVNIGILAAVYLLAPLIFEFIVSALMSQFQNNLTVLQPTDIELVKNLLLDIVSSWVHNFLLKIMIAIGGFFVLCGVLMLATDKAVPKKS